MLETGAGVQGGVYGHFEVFQYPSVPGAPPLSVYEGWEDVSASGSDDPALAARDRGRAAVEAAMRTEFDRLLGEETRKAFDAGREKGRVEGRSAEREGQAAALGAAAQLRTRQAADLVDGFAVERDRFLKAVEQEVVDLALAVATRILRREAQMDPLLLTGAVRVALGQLSSSTQVKLRVPPGELDMWTEAMALLPNLAVKPTVLAGEGMRLGDCLVETELGTVDLGIRSQLGEIERGFFDRAGTSRASRAAAAVDAMSTAAEEDRL
jgi:flagellar biosynthesis/type III secretory pathway protein FliH